MGYFISVYTLSGYNETFCSYRTFLQCSDRTCSVPTEHFFQKLRNIGTFLKLLRERKLQNYVVIGQKKLNNYGIFSKKIEGIFVI